ncbi:MAG: hypothetical protein EXS37_10770 [Opitutus sp.]|nr:hypothetical protein [Opitutus sp.]
MPTPRRLFLLVPVLVLLCGASLAAADFPALKPLLAVPDQVVLREDYTTPKPLAKGVYQTRQGTRWSVADGVLRGLPSSAEFQATKKDHHGYEPRISIPACPQEFAIQFDVRFIGGQPTAIVPFVEFGHHMARVTWAGGGANLNAESGAVQLAAAPDFKIESGRWYRALAEIKGEEFVIQFAGGPTLYGKHASFGGQKDGFGVAGPKGGTVELDNITVWSVKPEVQADWEKTRVAFPAPAAVAPKQSAAKKKAK